MRSNITCELVVISWTAVSSFQGPLSIANCLDKRARKVEVPRCAFFIFIILYFLLFNFASMTEMIMRRMKWKTAICIWMKCSPKLNVTGVDPTQETADFRKHSFFQHFLEKNRSNEVCIRLGFYTSLSKMFFNFTSVKRFVCFSIHSSLTLSN